MLAYVTNSGDNTVSVVNLLVNTAVTTIPVGNTPVGLDITPDGRFVYVANSADNTVSVIRTLTNSVIQTINLATAGVVVPYGVRVRPDGRFVYVSGTGSGNVAVIDTRTNTVAAVVTVSGVSPAFIDITSNSRYAFVTLYDVALVSRINLDVNLEVSTLALPAGALPLGIRIAPQGSFAYVANSGLNNLSVIDIPTNSVAATTIATQLNPQHIVFNTRGTRAYVTNATSGTISIIDTFRSTPVAAITVSDTPIGIDITPDGSTLVTALSTANTVAEIDAVTNLVSANILVGLAPLHVAVRRTF